MSPLTRLVLIGIGIQLEIVKLSASWGQIAIETGVGEERRVAHGNTSQIDGPQHAADGSVGRRLVQASVIEK